MPDIRVVASGLQFPEGPVAEADGPSWSSRSSGDRQPRPARRHGRGGGGAGPAGRTAWRSARTARSMSATTAASCSISTAANNRMRRGVHPHYTGGRIERLDLATGEIRTLYDRCGENRLVRPETTSSSTGRAASTSPITASTASASGTMAGCTTPAPTARRSPRSRIDGDAERRRPVAGRLDGLRLGDGDRAALGLRPRGAGTGDTPPVPVARMAARLVCGLPGYQRFDSMAVDAHGNICVAS